MHTAVDLAACAVRGFVAQRKADGCEVYLGCPNPVASPVEGACAAALQLLETLPRLQAFVQRCTDTAIGASSMRLAVHSGAAVIAGGGSGEAHGPPTPRLHLGLCQCPLLTPWVDALSVTLSRRYEELGAASGA